MDTYTYLKTKNPAWKEYTQPQDSDYLCGRKEDELETGYISF